MDLSFKKYCESYSGIDGGDVNAKYWFVGIEWSDLKDIEYKDGKWKAPNKIKEINIEDTEKWKFENRLNKIYEKLPEYKNKKIFSKGSNSLKLNLLPLPFKNFKEHSDFEKLYQKKIGIKTYTEYVETILDLRKNLFSELLKNGEKRKVVFCFGLTFRDEFKKIFGLDQCEKIVPQDTYRVEAYETDNKYIKKVFILPFYFAYKDIEKIVAD